MCSEQFTLKLMTLAAHYSFLARHIKQNGSIYSLGPWLLSVFVCKGKPTYELILGTSEYCEESGERRCKREGRFAEIESICSVDSGQTGRTWPAKV